MIILNRLLAEPYLCERSLIEMVKRSDNYFFSRYSHLENMDNHFYFIQDKFGKDLISENALFLATNLIQETFFVLKNDTLIDNKITRDPQLFSFINDHIDVFIYVALLKLTKQDLNKLDFSDFSMDSLKVKNNELWKEYLFRNPESQLLNNFRSDPKVEHLLSQNKFNELSSFFACFD